MMFGRHEYTHTPATVTIIWGHRWRTRPLTAALPLPLGIVLNAQALPKKMMHMMASISDVSRGGCGGRGIWYLFYAFFFHPGYDSLANCRYLSRDSERVLLSNYTMNLPRPP